MDGLTRDEVLDLLSFVQSYDARETSGPVVAAWSDAALRGRWTFDLAVEAVQDHYARSTAFLMPGHITEALRQRRAQPPPVPEQRRALTGPAPADPSTVAEIMAKVSRELGWDREIDHRTVMAQPCGYCRARPGEECTRVSKRTATGRAPCGPHPARRAAAEDALMNEEAT